MRSEPDLDRDAAGWPGLEPLWAKPRGFAKTLQPRSPCRAAPDWSGGEGRGDRRSRRRTRRGHDGQRRDLWLHHRQNRRRRRADTFDDQRDSWDGWPGLASRTKRDVCHCCGVLGEAVRVANQPSLRTANVVERLKPGHPRARPRWPPSTLARHATVPFIPDPCVFPAHACCSAGMSESPVVSILRSDGGVFSARIDRLISHIDGALPISSCQHSLTLRDGPQSCRRKVNLTQAPQWMRPLWRGSMR